MFNVQKFDLEYFRILGISTVGISQFYLHLDKTIQILIGVATLLTLLKKLFSKEKK